MPSRCYGRPASSLVSRPALRRLCFHPVGFAAVAGLPMIQRPWPRHQVRFDLQVAKPLAGSGSCTPSYVTWQTIESEKKSILGPRQCMWPWCMRSVVTGESARSQWHQDCVCVYSRPTSHLLRKRKRKGAASVTLEASMQIFQYGQAGQKGLKSPLKLLEDIYRRYIRIIYRPGESGEICTINFLLIRFLFFKRTNYAGL